MKITVPLPSRHRPAGLLAALTTLDALASGIHQITYVVMLDTDDADSRGMVSDWQRMDYLPKNTHVIVEERGERVLNARTNEVCGTFAANVYYQASDDSFPLTQHWDEILVGVSQMVPAFCWQEKNDPGNATYIALTEKWRQATGRFYPEYFPFWFSDTWIAEVHALAFAKGIAVVNQLQLGGKRGTTQGMRDLDFWFRFFAATRVERVEEARKVASAFGFTLNMSERQEILEAMEAADAKQLQNVASYESRYGSHAEPESELYTKKKAEARAWITENERRIVLPPNTILRPH